MREVDRLYREIEGAEIDGYFVDLAISSTWCRDGGDWDREPSSELSCGLIENYDLRHPMRLPQRCRR